MTIRGPAAIGYLRLVSKMTLSSFAITLYGQCCRRHVVGQRVVSDIGVIRGC